MDDSCGFLLISEVVFHFVLKSCSLLACCGLPVDQIEPFHLEKWLMSNTRISNVEEVLTKILPSLNLSRQNYLLDPFFETKLPSRSIFRDKITFEIRSLKHTAPGPHADRKRVQCGPQTSRNMKILKEIFGRFAYFSKCK